MACWKKRGILLSTPPRTTPLLQMLSILVMWFCLPPCITFCWTFAELIQLSKPVRNYLFLLLLLGYFPCRMQGRNTIPTWEWQSTRSGEAVLEPLTTTAPLSMVLRVATYYRQIKKMFPVHRLNMLLPLTFFLMLAAIYFTFPHNQPSNKAAPI